MVDITGFSETNDGMDKDVSLTGSCRSDGEFSMGTMHWITGLEGDDTGPMEFLEMCSEFSGRDFVSASQLREVHLFSI